MYSGNVSIMNGDYISKVALRERDFEVYNGQDMK